MGGSEWQYFVPYQADIEKALQELRQAEFETGDFYYPDDTYREHTEEERWNWLRYGVPLPGSEGLPKPDTIKNLLQLKAEEGTGTILDIDSAYPLSSEQLIEIFGTDKPTRALVDAALAQPPYYISKSPPYHQDNLLSLTRYLQKRANRWRGDGTYIIVYKDDQPDEILFIGYSGD